MTRSKEKCPRAGESPGTRDSARGGRGQGDSQRQEGSAKAASRELGTASSPAKRMPRLCLKKPSSSAPSWKSSRTAPARCSHCP